MQKHEREARKHIEQDLVELRNELRSLPRPAPVAEEIAAAVERGELAPASKAAIGTAPIDHAERDGKELIEEDLAELRKELDSLPRPLPVATEIRSAIERGDLRLSSDVMATVTESALQKGMHKGGSTKPPTRKP